MRSRQQIAQELARLKRSAMTFRTRRCDFGQNRSREPLYMSAARTFPAHALRSPPDCSISFRAASARLRIVRSAAVNVSILGFTDRAPVVGVTTSLLFGCAIRDGSVRFFLDQNIIK